jgi:hypothetical protein
MEVRNTPKNKPAEISPRNPGYPNHSNTSAKILAIAIMMNIYPITP